MDNPGNQPSEGPVTYTFDHVCIGTTEITTDKGEAAARQAADALNSLDARADGDLELGWTDIDPATVYKVIRIAPRGRAYLVSAQNASGADAPVSDDPCVPEPITGLARSELSERLAAYRAAAESPSGDGEHDAASELADTVEALLDERPGPAAGPPPPARTTWVAPDPLQEDRHLAR